MPPSRLTLYSTLHSPREGCDIKAKIGTGGKVGPACRVSLVLDEVENVLTLQAVSAWTFPHALERRSHGLAEQQNQECGNRPACQEAARACSDVGHSLQSRNGVITAFRAVTGLTASTRKVTPNERATARSAIALHASVTLWYGRANQRGDVNRRGLCSYSVAPTTGRCERPLHVTVAGPSCMGDGDCCITEGGVISALSVTEGQRSHRYGQA